LSLVRLFSFLLCGLLHGLLWVSVVPPWHLLVRKDPNPQVLQFLISSNGWVRSVMVHVWHSCTACRR